mgnify:CR=1 FL=1
MRSKKFSHLFFPNHISSHHDNSQNDNCFHDHILDNFRLLENHQLLQINAFMELFCYIASLMLAEYFVCTKRYYHLQSTKSTNGCLFFLFKVYSEAFKRNKCSLIATGASTFAVEFLKDLVTFCGILPKCFRWSDNCHHWSVCHNFSLNFFSVIQTIVISDFINMSLVILVGIVVFVGTCSFTYNGCSCPQ